MIVKNEIDNLEKALESIKDHVDEIVIVDTGSTDGTQELAKRYADVYDEIEWQNDFSAARNHSMDLATGDRIMILDADEYVTTGWDDIMEGCLQPDFICGTLHVLNITTQGAVRGERVVQPRIFRNEDDGSRDELRYSYAVHNQIDDAVHAFAKKFMRKTGRRGVVAAISAEIVHTGYHLSTEQVLEKYTPRLAILREEIRKAKYETENPRDVAYFQYQLALMLHMVYNVEDALPLWDEIDYSQLNTFNRWYSHYIAARAFRKNNYMEKAMWHCNGMFEAMADRTGSSIPNEPVAYVIAGICMCEMAAEVADKELHREGLIMMIEGYLKNLIPDYGARCVVHKETLQKDIGAYVGDMDKELGLRIGLEEDPGTLLRLLRDLQVELAPFDESILDLVAQ